MKAGDIKTVGMMGGGVMGGGIGQTLALAGYNVVVRDLTDELLEKTRSGVIDGRFGLKGGVERGKITQQQMDAAVANLSYTTKVEDLRNVDLIVEAVPEDLDLKKKVWAELDDLIKPGAIFATNTSGFAIRDLNKAVARKELFIGMHWFSPANIMRLVELVYAPETSTETIEALQAVCDKAGKVSIRVKDAPGEYGFVANRIYFAAVAEARKVRQQGIATDEDINKAMVYGFNWPVGPLAMVAGARRGFA
jgi:3-hydroxybutyryl-CoA dehydrogenase